MLGQAYAAVVLAGGAGRRLGGPAKPTLPVGGASMLARVLAAVADAVPRIVVGPGSLAAGLPPDVVLTCERPPGGGPVAAIAAGLSAAEAATGTDPDVVAVLAADLPFLTEEAVAALAAGRSAQDGAVYVDHGGRRQLLCGLWQVDALRGRLAAIGDPTGQSVRHLTSGLSVAEVVWPGNAPGPPPWYDCDTQSDLAQAREWT